MRPGEALSEPMEKDAFLDYELMIYICEGTEAEELEWFQVINIASEPLSTAVIVMKALDCAVDADVVGRPS